MLQLITELRAKWRADATNQRVVRESDKTLFTLVRCLDRYGDETEAFGGSLSQVAGQVAALVQGLAGKVAAANIERKEFEAAIVRSDERIKNLARMVELNDALVLQCHVNEFEIKSDRDSAWQLAEHYADAYDSLRELVENAMNQLDNRGAGLD